MTLTPDRAGSGATRLDGTLVALARAEAAGRTARQALADARLALGTARGWAACGIFLATGPLSDSQQTRSLRQAVGALSRAADAVALFCDGVTDAGLSSVIDLPDPSVLRALCDEETGESAVALRTHILHAQDTARSAGALIAHGIQLIGQERVDALERLRTERIRRSPMPHDQRGKRWGKLLTRARVAAH